jgi:hypothetical protein
MGQSNKENFIQIFRGEPADRILWIADLTYWRDSQIIKGILPDEYRGIDGFLKLHKDLGVVPYYIYALDEQEPDGMSVHQIGAPGRPFNGVFQYSFEGVDIETIVNGTILETKFHYQEKTFIQKKAYLPQSFCYAFIQYPIQKAEDLKCLRKIYEQCIFRSNYSDYLEIGEKWGDEGIPIAPLPRSPLSALIVDWMGIEAFTYAQVDEPIEIQKTIDCIDEANDQAFQIIIKSPAEIFHFCDNLSGTSYSSFFPRYAANYYARRFIQLHQAGKKAAVHIDGTLKGILNQVAATGADALEALTPDPVGDVTVEDLRKESQSENIILWGGLPAVMFTSFFAREDLIKQVNRIQKQWKENPRFIAGSADQIPPDADLDYLRLASELFNRGRRIDL